jgi:hypothetical protein
MISASVPPSAEDEPYMSRKNAVAFTVGYPIVDIV